MGQRVSRSSSGLLVRPGKVDMSTNFVFYDPETWKFCLEHGTILITSRFKKVNADLLDLGKRHKVFVDFETLDFYYESNAEPYYQHIPKDHQEIRFQISYNSLKPLYFNLQTQKMFYYIDTHLIILNP